MKIEFYIPSDEFIPSTLRLKVDDEIDVYYEKLQTDFGYRFTFFKFQQGVSRETATEIVNQIVARMVSQSYDHGSQRQKYSWAGRGTLCSILPSCRRAWPQQTICGSALQ